MENEKRDERMIKNKKLEEEVLGELSAPKTAMQIHESLKVWKRRQVQDCLLNLYLKKVVSRDKREREYVYFRGESNIRI